MSSRSNPQGGPPGLWIVVTHGTTARLLLRGQLAYLRQNGFAVTVVGSPGPDLDRAAEREGVRSLAVPMSREISPFKDLGALLRLLRLLRQERPQIVSAGTPKAGLLAMLAARLARVPARLYLLRGLRLETARGLRRWLLTAAERLAAVCAHRVICVSSSLRARYLELGLTTPDKARVLGSGSSNGIDLHRFDRPELDGAGDELRRALGIPPEAKVVGFVGRLTRDKGIADLVRAFGRLRSQLGDARLLLLGRLEDGDPVDREIVERIRAGEGIHAPGEVDDPERYYRAMDLLAFPSYREGMPNVPLEAAACRRAAVGYRVTGTVDAIVDGETGRLVEPGDWPGLADAVLGYLLDPELRAAHGEAARRRVEAELRHERLRELWRQEYVDLLTEKRLAPPGATATAERPPS